MFKNTLVFALLFGFLATAFSAVSTGDYSSPDHPGKCVISPDFIVDPGTHQAPDGCARIICSASGHAETQTCGVELAAGGCTLGNVLHPDADYPDCCHHAVICD